MNTLDQIPSQSRLPLRMALDIVMQGFRIRFGRSLITVFGVFLGIMFLIASAATFIVRNGVKEEDRLRTQTTRMWNTLAAEVGAVAGHDVGVIQTGPMSEAERRLLNRLEEEKPSAVLWLKEPDGIPASPPMPSPRIRNTTLSEFTDQLKCIVIVGAGPLPQQVNNHLISSRYAQPVALSDRQLSGATADTRLHTVSISGLPTAEEIARMQSEARVARSRLVWILIISLLVTIISICNAMLMSVVERFREIGTMKCLGADSRFVRRLFLIESSFIGLAGGLGGAAAGVVFSVAYHGFVYGFAVVFSSLNVAALGACFAIGAVAGLILSVLAALYPAGIASGMVPANALRYDA